MTHTATTPLLGPEFDSFLFASIAEEKNGLLLSVLSALARLNLDPWQEAAQLAKLPKDTATRRLASLIARQTGNQSKPLDTEAIAARLVALLPAARANAGELLRETPRTGALVNSRGQKYMYVAIMAALLGSQLVMAAHQRPVQSANLHEQTKSASETPKSSVGLHTPDAE
jgi:hypothetical protein